MSVFESEEHGECECGLRANIPLLGVCAVEDGLTQSSQGSRSALSAD